MAENEVDWDVVYDDRGHFIEPHTGHIIGLGTISVREYLGELAAPKLIAPGFAPGAAETRGPDGCFGAVLFVEKEGFLPLFEAVQLAERFDLDHEHERNVEHVGTSANRRDVRRRP
jgi:hypothetical protein